MSRAEALPKPRKGTLALVLVAALVVASMLGLAMNLALGFVPLVAVGVLYAVWKLPLRASALALLFLILAADYIPEVPNAGLWESPLYWVGQYLFVNMSTTIGIGALRLPMADLAVLMLLGVGIWRRATKSTIDQGILPSARPLNRLLAISAGTVLVLELFGLATGGNANESLWQLRHLLLLPLTAFLFSMALKGDGSDYKWIAGVMVAAAVWKSLVGVYVIEVLARQRGVFPEFATSHSDTLNYVAVLMMAVAMLFERGDRRFLGKALLYVPIVVLGMITNDRRIAYVSLAFCFILVLAMTRASPLKRFLLRAAVVLSPLFLVYTVAGWNSTSGVFGLAQFVKSLIKGDQSQAGYDYRDIENFDLLGTWADYPIFGSGFGHVFHEPVKLPDISFIMPTYQYHPHNSILWLWSVGGVIGFSGIFLWLAGTVYLAARSYRFAASPTDRAAALVIICMLIAHLNQCFGDMGTRNYFGTFLCGVAVALASKLAVRVGAFPAPSALGPEPEARR